MPVDALGQRLIIPKHRFARRPADTALPLSPDREAG
jgi:hypothetical protein